MIERSLKQERSREEISIPELELALLKASLDIDVKLRSWNAVHLELDRLERHNAKIAKGGLDEQTELRRVHEEREKLRPRIEKTEADLTGARLAHEKIFNELVLRHNKQ